MPAVAHVPAAPADRHEILEGVSGLERRATLGARVGHAEPEHADDAAGHVAAAPGADGARPGVPEDGAVVGDAGGRARAGGGRGAVFGVAVQRLVAVVAAEGHLARGRGQKRFLAMGGDGELGRLDVEVDARQKESGGVENGPVGLTPVIDERVGEVAGRGVGEGEQRGLQVGEFAGILFEEGDRLLRQAGENDAFNGPVLNAVRRRRGDVFAQFFVIQIHQRHSDPVAKRKRRLGQHVMPVSVADQRENGSSVGVVEFLGHVPDRFLPHIIGGALDEACQR